MDSLLVINPEVKLAGTSPSVGFDGWIPECEVSGGCWTAVQAQKVPPTAGTASRLLACDGGSADLQWQDCASEHHPPVTCRPP